MYTLSIEFQAPLYALAVECQTPRRTLQISRARLGLVQLLLRLLAVLLDLVVLEVLLDQGLVLLLDLLLVLLDLVVDDLEPARKRCRP